MTKTEITNEIASLIAWNAHTCQQTPLDQELFRISGIENTAYKRVAQKLNIKQKDLEQAVAQKWHEFNQRAIANNTPDAA